MTPIQSSLPGLDHLISVLKAHGVGPVLRPPSPTAPRAGDMVMGAPLDPLLASVYARSNGAILGELIVLQPELHQDDLVERNQSLRRGFDPRIDDLLLYGKIQSLAYYFATIPSLADPDGIQPVIYVDINDPPPFLTFSPIASSVDRAFDLYAHYAEMYLIACGSFEEVPPPGSGLFFPESVVSHIARDDELVEMLRDGRFKKFVAPEPDSQAWVECILKEARALH